MSNDQTPAPEAAPSTKPRLPVLIGMVAVGLALGGGTGAMFVGPMVAEKMGKKSAVVANADGEHGAEAAEGDSAAQGANGASGSVHLLENLVLNPAGSGGSRFLLLSLAIEVGTSKAGEEFKARDAELRDLILTALGKKTVDELTDIARRDEFKQELQVTVDARFGKKAVKSLYFPQFVVQ
jgi:flagellar protein FliL